MPVMTLERALTMALDLHKAGRLAEAQEAYQKILDKLPLSHDALHGCGLIAQESQSLQLDSRDVHRVHGHGTGS